MMVVINDVIGDGTRLWGFFYSLTMNSMCQTIQRGWFKDVRRLDTGNAKLMARPWASSYQW